MVTDGYGEMLVLATHGVRHRVSLDCAATIGMTSTMTARCQLGNSWFFVTWWHGVMRLPW